MNTGVACRSRRDHCGDRRRRSLSRSRLARSRRRRAEELHCDFVGGPVTPLWDQPPPAWLDLSMPSIRRCSRCSTTEPRCGNSAWASAGRSASTSLIAATRLRKPASSTPRSGAKRVRFAARHNANGTCARAPPAAAGSTCRTCACSTASSRIVWRRQYFRRWHYWHGISRARLYYRYGFDPEEPEAARYDHPLPSFSACRGACLPKALKSLRSYVWRRLRGQSARAFEYELWLCFFAGMVRQSVPNRAKGLPGARPVRPSPIRSVTRSSTKPTTSAVRSRHPPRRRRTHLTGRNAPIRHRPLLHGGSGRRRWSQRRDSRSARFDRLRRPHARGDAACVVEKIQGITIHRAVRLFRTVSAPDLHVPSGPRPTTRTSHGLQQTSQSWTNWPRTSGSTKISTASPSTDTSHRSAGRPRVSHLAGRVSGFARAASCGVRAARSIRAASGGKAGGRAIPAQLLDVVEHGNLGAQRREIAKQERALAFAGERGRQRAGVGGVDAPGPRSRRESLRDGRSARARPPTTSRPSRAARDTRRRHRRRARGSRGSTPGATPNFATTPASSMMTLRPPVQLDDAGAADALREVLVGRADQHLLDARIRRRPHRRRGQRVVRLELDHRPDHDAERRERLLEQRELREEIGVDAGAGLVAGPESLRNDSMT